MTYLLTFTLAFCSVVYELLLGQTLSAFLGNTVLRYSVTIGLYMFSMGVGAMLVRGRIRENPVVSLQIVELALSILGGFALSILFMIDFVGLPAGILSLTAHSFIIAIGLLTGLEIPLLIEIKNIEAPESEAGVLGIDYLGAFLGTLIFAFLFYPVIGLTKSAFLVAGLNALAGSLLIAYGGRVPGEKKRIFNYCLSASVVLLFILSVCVFRSEEINGFLVGLYLT